MTSLPPGYAEAAADMADFDARVRAVVDARLRSLAEFVTRNKCNGWDIDANDILLWLAAPARQDAQPAAPNGPLDAEGLCARPDQPDVTNSQRASDAPPASPAAPAPSGMAGAEACSDLEQAGQRADFLDERARDEDAAGNQMIAASFHLAARSLRRQTAALTEARAEVERMRFALAEISDHAPFGIDGEVARLEAEREWMMRQAELALNGEPADALRSVHKQLDEARARAALPREVGDG